MPVIQHRDFALRIALRITLSVTVQFGGATGGACCASGSFRISSVSAGWNIDGWFGWISHSLKNLPCEKEPVTVNTTCTSTSGCGYNSVTVRDTPMKV